MHTRINIPQLGELSQAVPVFPSSTLNETVSEHFAVHPEASSLLVDLRASGKGGLRLLQGRYFHLRMSSRYGWALYAQKPVSALLEEHSDVVPLLGDTSLERAVDAAMSRPMEERYDDLIVELGDGRYGTLSIEALLTNAISHKAKMEEQIAGGERRFRALVTHATDVIMMVSLSGRISYVSPSAGKISGLDPAHFIGRQLLDLIHPEERSGVASAVADVLEREAASAPLEMRITRQDGSWAWVEGTCTNLLDNPDVTSVVINYRDTTKRRELEEQLRRRAFHDPLTGLFNRAVFRNRLEYALDHRDRSGGRVAVVYIDLDDFKTINDSMGHQAGDQVLCLIAARIGRNVRPTDTVARLGGDEFAILFDTLSEQDDIDIVMNRMRITLRDPLNVDGHILHVSFSAGISEAGRNDNTDDLLRHADIAMYRAKREGKDRVARYDPAMGKAAKDRMRLKGDLARAIEDGQLSLAYQPIIEIRSRRLVSYEALLRWSHPEKGQIPPDRFIPLAEDSNLIIDIGAWVLDRACRDLGTLSDKLSSRLSVAVNLSPRQFTDPGLEGMVVDTINRHGVEADRITLEITESASMTDAETASQQLEMLKSHGFMLAIDDFGTGYSSLSYLKRFPIDNLKIDRSFVRTVGEDIQDDAFIQAIVSLAHSLDIPTTAEGIETPEQMLRLRSLGCDRGQGYLIGRPTDLSLIDGLAIEALTI